MLIITDSSAITLDVFSFISISLKINKIDFFNKNQFLLYTLTVFFTGHLWKCSGPCVKKGT